MPLKTKCKEWWSIIIIIICYCYINGSEMTGILEFPLTPAHSIILSNWIFQNFPKIFNKLYLNVMHSYIIFIWLFCEVNYRLSILFLQILHYFLEGKMFLVQKSLGHFRKKKKKLKDFKCKEQTSNYIIRGRMKERFRTDGCQGSFAPEIPESLKNPQSFNHIFPFNRFSHNFKFLILYSHFYVSSYFVLSKRRINELSRISL